MTRRLLNLLTVLSLLLCAAVCVLWARSYSRSDLLVWTFRRSDAFVWTAPGVIRVEYRRALFADDPPNVDQGLDYSVREPMKFERMPGSNLYCVGQVAFVTGERWSDYHYALFLPGWFAFALTASLSAIGMARFARRQQHPTTHCQRCGYDLRATPDRCPECDTIAATQ